MANRIKLGVNIDHVATLRQARGTSYPSLVDAVFLCEKAGADGITLHLREDRRHIQDADVWDLKKCIKTRMNLEMALCAEIVDIALAVEPDEVCLVPERREELTTEGGLDALGFRAELEPVVAAMQQKNIQVSLFIDPETDQIKTAADLGVPFIELHTGRFCEVEGVEAEEELARLMAAADLAHQLGIQVNAGHGLALHNVKPILTMPWLDTLNIGHSIICRAVMIGLENAVQEMNRAIAVE